VFCLQHIEDGGLGDPLSDVFLGEMHPAFIKTHPQYKNKSGKQKKVRTQNTGEKSKVQGSLFRTSRMIETSSTGNNSPGRKLSNLTRTTRDCTGLSQTLTD
jgi:hypothetical protein